MQRGLGQMGALAASFLLGCGAPTHAKSLPAERSAPTAISSTPARSVFVPPSAEPTRKAKLLALVPELDGLLTARAAEAGATGSAVALVLEGEVVYVRGFGVRDLDSKRPVDGDTLFRIGSVSKSITALAVLKLRDQGKLSLDVPAASYVPALASLPRPTQDSPDVTVRHLLTMTSGLPYDDVWGAVTFGLSDAELSQLLARGPFLAGAPGEKYRYSNLGFALLGQVVEAVAHEPFEQFVARELFEPLGMKSSGYVTGPIPRERLATGYFKDGERFVAEPVDSDGVFAPAGGAYTSMNDLARYAAYQLAAYPPRDEVETGPVRRSTLREMHAGHASGRWGDDYPILRRRPDGTPQLNAFSYGMGWTQNTTCVAEGMVQHGGYEPGYFTVIRLLPAQGLAFVTISTTSNIGSIGNDQTFEPAMGLLQERGIFQRAPVAPSRQLSAARETVIQLLAGYDADLVARSFDPLTLRYSFIRTRADLEAALRDHGRCHGEGELIPDSATHGRFRASCERGALEFTVFLTPHAKPLIQALELRREMPVTDAESAMARRIVESLASNAPFPAKALAPGVDPQPLEHRLARLRGAYGECSLEKPLWNDTKGETLFRLRCRDASMDLKIRLDPKTALLLDFQGSRVREFGAVCAE